MPLKVQIVIDGKQYEVEYEAAGGIVPSSADSADQAQSLVLPTPRAATSGAAAVDEIRVCRSPVAGIVTRINVAAGDAVGAGDVLLVVEAMKMENNLASANAARVKAVNVKLRDTVAAGTIVVEFE